MHSTFQPGSIRISIQFQVIGKNSPSFIEKRKKGLEIYLQDVLVHLQLTMPREFVEFLHFDEYDVIFLLQSMASQFFLYGDTLISSSKMHTFAILECMAISKRMKLPCHPLENTENRFDFSHVLDFCIQLQYIAIVPSKYSKVDVRHCEDLEQFGHIMPDRTVPLGTSNIVPADLKFDLNAFRNLKKLALLGVSIENISIGKMISFTPFPSVSIIIIIAYRFYTSIALRTLCPPNGCRPF